MHAKDVGDGSSELIIVASNRYRLGERDGF
jgi:hypothetical protein